MTLNIGIKASGAWSSGWYPAPCGGSNEALVDAIARNVSETALQLAVHADAALISVGKMRGAGFRIATNVHALFMSLNDPS